MQKRIYGIDTGGYDPQDILKMADWELFLEYYSLTLLAWRISHNAYKNNSRGQISGKGYSSIANSLEEMQYAIEYLLYIISRRNGIAVNKPASGQHIKPDREAFMKWYRYYDNHFMHQMSDSTWKDFERKRKAGADVSKYLPKGNWRTS